MNESEENLTSEFGPRPKLQLLSTSQDDERIHHQCAVCNKAYLKASRLKRHYLTIHERVRHPCTVCSKTFSETGHLKTHIREQHEGKRNEFKCDECHKVFHHKGNLTQHKQIHPGARFPCTLWDKTFSQARSLKRHIRKTHSQDQEESSAVGNENEIHGHRSDDTREKQEMGHNSFFHPQDWRRFRTGRFWCWGKCIKLWIY